MAVTDSAASSGPPPREDEKVRVGPLLAALLISIGGVLPVFLTGALAVQLKRDLAFGNFGLGVAVAVFWGLSGLTAVHVGRFVDRLGWRRAVWLTAGTSVVLMVSMATVMQTYVLLLVLLSIGGVVMSLSIMAGNLVIANEMPMGSQALMFGIKQSAIPAGTLLAGVSVPAVALLLGWQWAFVMGAAFPIVGAALIGRDDVDVSQDPETGRDLTFTVTRPLVLLAFAGSLGTASATSFIAFLVVAAVDFGVPEATAGYIVAGTSAFGLLVRIASGWAVDRFGGKGLPTVTGMLMAGAIGYLLFVPEQAGLVLPASLLVFATGWAWTGLFYFGVIRYYRESPASATGVVQVGMSLGAAVGPILFSVAVDGLGYGFSWGALAVVALLAGILVHVAASWLERSQEAVTQR